MSNADKTPDKPAAWIPWTVFAGALLATFGLGMLVVSIMERRWEAARPQLVVQDIDEWETDNSKWGQNYPREYETFRMTETVDTRTAFGGAYQHDYLEIDPRQKLANVAAKRRARRLLLRADELF